MLSLTAIIGDVELPGSQGLTAPARTAAHISPAFIGVAILALALIAFLVWDVCRQKWVERRERQRLERFRDQKRRSVSTVPDPNKGRDTIQS